MCPELPPLVNGTISYTGDTIPPFDQNTTATFSCNEGFVLSSNANRVCLDDGNGNALWSGESPVCGGKLYSLCSVIFLPGDRARDLKIHYYTF